ncbi:MAG: hypothetical protein EOP45_21200 [Sphingobacteriaceae bacterium]|nr:MAG: hypothetical protein EOP45_21200 [Sphingobacteriaceae bacterium]
MGTAKYRAFLLIFLICYGYCYIIAVGKLQGRWIKESQEIMIHPNVFTTLYFWKDKSQSRGSQLAFLKNDDTYREVFFQIYESPAVGYSLSKKLRKRIETATTTTRPFDFVLLRLQFSYNFEPGTTYSLTVTNLMDYAHYQIECKNDRTWFRRRKTVKCRLFEIS